jgi:hypothetical protein
MLTVAGLSGGRAFVGGTQLQVDFSCTVMHLA